jgi:hypothetical protein
MIVHKNGSLIIIISACVLHITSVLQVSENLVITFLTQLLIVPLADDRYTIVRTSGCTNE